MLNCQFQSEWYYLQPAIIYKFKKAFAQQLYGGNGCLCHL